MARQLLALASTAHDPRPLVEAARALLARVDAPGARLSDRLDNVQWLTPERIARLAEGDAAPASAMTDKAVASRTGEASDSHGPSTTEP